MPKKNVFTIQMVNGKSLKVVDPKVEDIDFLGIDGPIPRYWVNKCFIDGISYRNVCVPINSIVFYGYQTEEVTL